MPAKDASRKRPVGTCSSCRFYFWDEHFEQRAWIDEAGNIQEEKQKIRNFVCRRYPQYIVHQPEDWCGEYKQL